MKNDSFKQVIGVIKGSKSIRYRLLGRFLKPNEYMVIEGVGEFYKNMRLNYCRAMVAEASLIAIHN